VRYGSFINERNPWWPYFRLFTDYKARLSAVLQHTEMFADIALLPPIADTWSKYGAQNEPFPSLIHPTWQTLIWESIHQNGSGCDYISEQVIMDAVMHDGYLHYGPRKYHTIILIEVQSMEPVTAKKLFDFVSSGGRIFCIEIYPDKSPGWNDHQQRDQELQNWIDKLKKYPDRFIILKKPANNFIEWYGTIQKKYQVKPYVSINKPNPFITQVRYQARDFEMIIFINSNMQDSHEITLTLAPEIISGKQAWIWDAESGERYRINTGAENITLELGPADLKLLVFDREKKGRPWKPLEAGDANGKALTMRWSVEWKHIDGTIKKKDIDVLKDLKEMPEFVNFSGTIIYRTNIMAENRSKPAWLNLGKVFGVSELFINGVNAGTRWYGRRIFAIDKFIKNGNNNIEIKVVTTMGNYLKNMTDNGVAQYWTNEKRKDQPLQSMGLLGPVTIY
jgi:hypothetical protein